MKWFTFSQVGRSVPLTALSLLLLPIASCLSAQEHEKNAPVKHRFAVVGGTIYPAPFERPITNGVVLIKNGKIIEVDEKAKLRIPPGAETIDCAGRTIVAGFWIRGTSGDKRSGAGIVRSRAGFDLSAVRTSNAMSILFY